MKPKILVVDDEPDIIEMIRGHFQLRGYEVVSADDGAEAIDVAGREKPDIVLMDLKMKTLDGDRAVGGVRRCVPGARIYVISAYQDEATKERVLSLPVDGYYEKPVSILELQSLIEQAAR